MGTSPPYYLPLVGGGKLFIGVVEPTGINANKKNVWLDTTGTTGVWKTFNGSSFGAGDMAFDDASFTGIVTLSGSKTYGINITGSPTNAAINIGGAVGNGISINKLTNTGGTLKIHCHQAAAGVEYANEFKGEFLSTSGIMDGISAHFHMAASGTGVMRSIIGVAYLDTGITLSGTDPTGSWINGILGSVDIAGVIDGTAVTVTGTYGGLGSMIGGTLTACKYMSAIWADSQVTQVPTSGESQLFLMTNGLGATLNQAIYVDANDRISEFAHFVNCATMISAKTDADIAYAHYRKLLVTVDGNPGWMYIEMAA